jgi:hypothetical protein
MTLDEQAKKLIHAIEKLPATQEQAEVLSLAVNLRSRIQYRAEVVRELNTLTFGAETKQ